MYVHREPVGAAGDLEQSVRYAAGQEDPVPGAEVHSFTADLECGRPGQQGDPLVLVLEVVIRRDVGPAQDLLDDDVAEGEDLFNALAGGGDVSPRPQGASDR